MNGAGTDPVTIGQIVFLITLISAVGGLWWRIEAAITKAKTEATTMATAASAQAALVQAQLQEHRLHVAEVYVTKAGLRETTEQIMGAISDVKSSVQGLTTRLDRIFEDQHPPSRSRRGS